MRLEHVLVSVLAAATRACEDMDPIDITVTSSSGAAGMCRQDGSPCPILIDVRTLSEWNAGHASCAERIPVQDDSSRTAEVLALADGDTSHPVVVYCRSGARAGSAATVLRNAGFTDVVNGGGWVEPAGNAAVIEEMCSCSTPCTPGSSTYTSCAEMLAAEGDGIWSTMEAVRDVHCQRSCGVTCPSDSGDSESPEEAGINAEGSDEDIVQDEGSNGAGDTSAQQDSATRQASGELPREQPVFAILVALLAVSRAHVGSLL